MADTPESSEGEALRRAVHEANIHLATIQNHVGWATLLLLALLILGLVATFAGVVTVQVDLP